MEKIGYFVLTAVVAYCCGNFNGAIITSLYHYNSDVRDQGSGNAGLTNFYRCYGAGMLFLVILIDLAKAVVAVLNGGILLGAYGMSRVGQALALLFVIAGHMFPAAYNFRGGKGVLSACGALAIIDWRVMLVLLVIFVVLVAITRYVSLGSVCTAALMPAGIWFSGHNLTATILTILSALLVIFMHRKNIQRLFNGTESKLTFKKSKA